MQRPTRRVNPGNSHRQGEADTRRIADGNRRLKQLGAGVGARVWSTIEPPESGAGISSESALTREDRPA